MPYDGVYEFIDEQLGFPQQAAGHRAKKPLPRRDIISAAEAERQAEIEARARQRNFQGTTGMTPDALPRVRQRPSTQDDDLYTRPPRSAVRYQPEETYQSGNTCLHVQEVVIPKKRRSAQTSGTAGRPARPQQEIYRDDIDRQVTERPGHRRRQKIRFHPLVWLGFGMIVMVCLWTIGSNALDWWQVHQDDSTYGRPRTFQTDAVVGHNDSGSNPSHFIALNLNRHVIVIELPGGDPAKAKIYPITTLFGDGQDLTPVTLSFKDVDGDGLVDMEIHLQDQTLVMINANGGFQPLKAGEKVHL
jgi:hypothetical protein